MRVECPLFNSQLEPLSPPLSKTLSNEWKSPSWGNGQCLTFARFYFAIPGPDIIGAEEAPNERPTVPIDWAMGRGPVAGWAALAGAELIRGTCIVFWAATGVVGATVADDFGVETDGWLSGCP